LYTPHSSHAMVLARLAADNSCAKFCGLTFVIISTALHEICEKTK